MELIKLIPHLIFTSLITSIKHVYLNLKNHQLRQAILIFNTNLCALWVVVPICYFSPWNSWYTFATIFCLMGLTNILILASWNRQLSKGD